MTDVTRCDQCGEHANHLKPGAWLNLASALSAKRDFCSYGCLLVYARARVDFEAAAAAREAAYEKAQSAA